MNLPPGFYRKVACGSDHTVAIRYDGTLVGWGNDDANQATPPAGVYTQVVAGRKHFLALRPDGTVLRWGNMPLGSTPPPDAFVQIDTNDFQSIGLRADGSVVTLG
ncbi:MAG: hypothetical protein JNM80_09970 [Phycisphaerae bacterium]|nr:hypothetical protein [Phycisphaerae bacterium]